MTLQAQISHYHPFNEQEERDQALLHRCLEAFPDVLTRDNALCHFTASAWVVNPSRDKVLMAYHNIYKSWSWLGGHADGEANLLQIALREVQEESGVKELQPLQEDPFSLEVLTVDGHIKRGQYVQSHLHLNVTYLLQADDHQAVRSKADENSAVRWFTLDEAIWACTEPWMREYVYSKLNQKLRMLI